MQPKLDENSEFSIIPIKEKSAYFLGECGSCGMFYALIITLSSYFYTDVMHISAITLGTVVIVSRCFDLVSDIIMGSLVDRTHSKWGKAKPWVVFATIPYAAAMVILFCLPASWTTAHQIAYIVITYNLAVTICYTVENIPWGSLPALMTRDKVQRAQLHSCRMLASPLGSALGVTIAMPLIAKLGGTQKDWIIVMSILATVGVICNFIACYLIKERVGTDKPAETPEEKKNHRKDIPSAMHNPYWWVAILITFVWNSFFVATSTVTPYFAKYILQNELLTSTVNNAQTITMAICAFSCYWLTKKWEKSTILKFTMVISLIGQAILAFCPMSTGFIVFGTIIRSVGFGCMGALMFAIATDAIEYGHWFTGHRAEGTTYSAVGIGNKMGVLLGSGFMAILLGAVGYDGTKAVQCEAALHMIRFLYMYSPAILAALTIIIMSLYKLDKKYDRVMSDLAAGKHAPNARYAKE